MRVVSNDYKEVMDRKIRNRAYVSVGLGVVNQDAQKDGTVSSGYAYWCSPTTMFDAEDHNVEYATMEENYFRADGSMTFMPDEYLQILENGFVSADLGGALRVDFGGIYDIKGLTLDFGSTYPTEFTVETEKKTLTYTNSKETFVTADVLGETTYILITPISMVGGQQRFRVRNILMGVGLNFSNKNIKDLAITDNASSISDELPQESVSINIFDEENRFNVDDENSFIGFLETMQNVNVSFGIELDDGSIEWLTFGHMFLTDWDSKKGVLSIKAVDKLSTLEDEYVLGDKIYTRTAYEEAVSIFTDAGLEADEYSLDEYLQDIVLTNPMPSGSHKECLQLLANACRCAIHSDSDGRIVIRANFAVVLEPDDLTVSTNGVADWSNPNNVLFGTEYVYADLTQNFFKADGSMYFLPENESYLETSYVSEQISDENGLFETNPTLTITMPAAYSYFGLSIDFDGNPPKKMIAHTYRDGTLRQSVEFNGLTAFSILYHDFYTFDQMSLEFVEIEPYNRVLVNKIAFGDLTDYHLTKDLMLNNPHGFYEEKTKSISVKVYTFENDESGEAKEVEDEVYVKKTIGVVGANKLCENPLVSTTEHATLLAEWLGNYYANNISYDVDYRGEPRINASDIIKMDSDVVGNLQVEVAEHRLKFNGAFSGSLQLRKALKMVE